MFLSMPHAWLCALLSTAGVPPLTIGVVAGDAAAAKRSLQELATDDEVRAALCHRPIDGRCFDDGDCARKAVASCDVDAIVSVELRVEADGAWVATRVVDREGATVFAL